MIKSINYITYSVANISKSIVFYKYIFKAETLVETDKRAYFTIGGLWLALYEENGLSMMNFKILCG